MILAGKAFENSTYILDVWLKSAGKGIEVAFLMTCEAYTDTEETELETENVQQLHIRC